MPSRMLDLTVRDPTVVYICPAHIGFSEIHDPNNGGHYPALDKAALCSRCVPWDELCTEWVEMRNVSTRCLLRQGHDRAHLSDVGLERYAWAAAEEDRDFWKRVEMRRRADARR